MGKLTVLKIPGLRVCTGLLASKRDSGGHVPASISDNGAILLGSNFTVDSHCDGRPVRVVTHAHSDHTKGLRSSVRRSLFVIATPITFRFLEVLGYKVPGEKRVELPYYKPINIDSERIMLVPARHIPGSAQVVVEAPDYRVGYTGDFKVPGTPPLRDLDVLVIDATYGSPRLQRRWKDWEALEALIAIIEDNIWEGPVWIYGYHGKLQEILLELRKRGVEYRIMADTRTIALARVAAEYENVNTGRIEVLTDPLLPGPGDIVLAHMRRRRSYTRLPGTHVTLTGWELRAVAVRTGPKSYNVSYSDHATFSEILDYIREANPGMVIVDGYRSSEAMLTAKYIERLLGVKATYMP